jgi:hypothetical protein
MEQLNTKIAELETRLANGEKSRGQRLQRTLAALREERERIIKLKKEIEAQAEARKAAADEQLRLHQTNLKIAEDKRKIERQEEQAATARVQLIEKYQDPLITLANKIKEVSSLELPPLIQERAIEDLEDKHAAIVAAEEAHQLKLSGVQQQHIDMRRQYEEDSAAAKSEFVIGQLGTITNAFAGQSKKMFKVTQGLSIAQTLISTYESATSAYKAMAGIPVVGPALGTAAAAAAIAAGKANVDQIRAQKFQGQAHDGLDFVPSTGTFLLERGERVVKKEDNKKLSEAIDRGNLGGGDLTVNFNINALDARAATDYIISNQNIIISIIQNAYTERGRAGPLG